MKKWKKRLSECKRSVVELKERLRLSDEEVERLKRIEERYPLCIPDYYLDLIDPEDREDPIRKMAIPDYMEFSEGGEKDTSGEADNTVVQGMQHKYDQTVLVLSTNQCAMYCRHCFRKRLVGLSSEEIAEKLRQDIRRSLLGTLDRSSASPVKSIRNLDMKKTIRKNLQHYDREQKRLMLEQVYFSSRIRRFSQWRVVIAVDESGSMLDSVIYSAVMAGIFAKLPMLDTRLVIFDTQVVDLSAHLDDPVETLMSIQLGGGTFIAGALRYCESLIEDPYKTMVVLVSDLCEGGSLSGLLSVSRGIIESGARLICLTALDMEANPVYDRRTAEQLADLGAYVGAMTPEALGDFMGKVMR